MFNEDFERCVECDSPYFTKHITYQLLKNDERTRYSDMVEKKKITQFKCEECGVKFGPKYELETLRLHQV